jgi:hypothetical protein
MSELDGRNELTAGWCLNEAVSASRLRARPWHEPSEQNNDGKRKAEAG